MNEGFADFVARDSQASYQRARGHLAKPHSISLAPEELISIDHLITLPRPPTERVNTYYDESERLVRFLVHTDKGRFLAFLQAMAGGEPFDSALARAYVGTFVSPSDFEAKFRAYASQDYGTALQDQ